MAGPLLKTATIRDFSGGWNVADNPHNLSSKYLPISDNIMVGVDGALSPRMGYKLFADLKQGISQGYSNQSVTLTTAIGQPYIEIAWTSHPFVSGDHITINSSSAGFGAFGTSQPYGTFGVRVISSSAFRIYMRTNAVGTVTTLATLLTCTRDTHMLGGNILDMAFFQGKHIIFSDIGEVCAIDENTKTITRIWDVSLSAALAGSPTGWRMCDGTNQPLKHVSFDVFRQGLLCVNGRFNDKPIEINFNRAVGQPVTQFLLDPGAGGGASNGFIYAADFIQSFDSYVLLYGSNNSSTTSSNSPTTVDISDENTNCVFVGATSPGNAVQIDLGRVTQTVEPTITGIANIRDKLFVAFHDSAMLGKIGTMNGTTHDPDFSDQIPQHGALNHRVIVNMGNDLLMTDYAGVPAFTQSQQQAQITPERISQLVDPELNKHLSRLSADTLQFKTFAVFNVRDRQYMLFVPKFDSSSVFAGQPVPFFVIPELMAEKTILVHAVNHTVSAGDYVNVSGATNVPGLVASDINGTRKVRAVVDTNYFLMEVASVPITIGASGGGASVTFAPVDDETIGYVFTFNPQLRIRRWTRFRDLYFTSGVLSRNGRVYFSSKNGRIYDWGTTDRPYFADKIADTGATDVGVDINFVAETPWSDFGQRLFTKVNESLRVDAQGSGRFTVDVYVDNIYQDRATFAYVPSARSEFLAPAARTDLVANDAGGFGAGTQTFGGGRRTREQFGYHYPFRAQLAKVRITGSTSTPLKISALHFAYKKGAMGR